MKRKLVFILVPFCFLFCSGCKGNEGVSEAKQKKGAIYNVIPVTVSVVKRGEVGKNFSFNGEIRPSQQVEISSRISGRIKKIMVEMGDQVKEGDTLVIMDEADLRARIEEAKASIEAASALAVKAEAEEKNARTLLERKEKLAAEKLVTPQELDNVRTTLQTTTAGVNAAKSQLAQAKANLKLLRTQLNDLRIKAPFLGHIDARYLDPGSFINAGTPILMLVRKNPIIARFQVDERSIGEIIERVGEGKTAVEIIVDSFPGEVFEGKIIRISPALQPETRTATVEAEISNESKKLMPGMYCTVKVDAGKREGVLIIPASSLVENVSDSGDVNGQKDGDLWKVFTVEKGKAVSKTVKLGWREGDVVEVIEGLKEGERIVVEGHGMLKDGAPVKVIGEQK